MIYVYIDVYAHIRRPFQRRAYWTSYATLNRHIAKARQQDSKTANPWQQGKKPARQQGSKAGKAGKAAKAAKAARQQGRKPAGQQGVKSMDLRFKLSRARTFGPNVSFSLVCRESPN